MGNTSSFKQRYKYWKETGELPYKNGIKQDLESNMVDDSPVKSSIPYPMLTSSDYDDARAYELGYFNEAGAKGHLWSNDRETGRILKSPTHPTISHAIWGDKAAGYDVININSQYYSKPNFIKKKTDNMKINPPMLPGYDGGKDDTLTDSINWIISHEGSLKQGKYHVAYQKKGDVPTIGYGTTNPKWVSKGRITEAEARLALMEDILANEAKLSSRINGYDSFPANAKMVLRDIAYNIGIGGLFKESPKFMKALSVGDYEEAARLMDWGNKQEGFSNGLLKRNRDRQNVWREAFSNYTQDIHPVETITLDYPIVRPFQPQLIRIPALNNQYHEQPYQVKYPYVQSNQSITNNQIAIPWEYIQQNNTFRMPALRLLIEAVLNGQDLVGFSGGKSGIYIKPSTRGTFTAAAKQRGMGVQLFASKVLSNPNNYREAMRKKAQFAHNAASWKH